MVNPEKLSKSISNRRGFVKNIGLGGVVAGALASKAAPAQTATPAFTDLDILNFALQVEYLDSSFFTMATSGMTLADMGIDTTGTGTAGAVTGGAQVTFTDSQAQRVATELAAEERQHVLDLRAGILSMGGSPVAAPAINLDALGMGFGSQAEFLAVGRIFEDLGVSAYAGAAPLLVNKTVIGTSARILASEATHAGNLRNLIDRLGVATTAVDAADILPPPSGSQFFSVNTQALVETRTPQEILYIAFGNAANATSGGFFPSGVNGLFNTSSAAPATYNGVMFSASPNPIAVPAGVTNGQTTLTWAAPDSSVIEIHVGSPTGPLFTHNINSGSMTTGNWVTNGLTFYLQDVSNGQALTATGTLATLTISLTTATS